MQKAIAEFGNVVFLRNEVAQNGSFLRSIREFCNTIQHKLLNDIHFEQTLLN